MPDPDGKEVFRPVIENTSFRPYHGPEETHKSLALLAVLQPGGKREVLLAGGIDGIVKYRIQ